MTETVQLSVAATHLSNLLDGTRSPIRVSLAWGPAAKGNEVATLDHLRMIAAIKDRDSGTRYACLLHYRRYVGHHAGPLELTFHDRSDAGAMNALAATFFEDEQFYSSTPPKWAVARTSYGELLRVADLRVIQLLATALGAVRYRAEGLASGLDVRGNLKLESGLSGTLDELYKHWLQIGIQI